MTFACLYILLSNCFFQQSTDTRVEISISDYWSLVMKLLICFLSHWMHCNSCIVGTPDVAKPQLHCDFAHSSEWLLHILLSLANTFSTRLLLIEHLIYLKHFVLFNCLKLMFVVVVVVDYVLGCSPTVKKKKGKIIVLQTIFSSFCMVLLLGRGTFVIHLSCHRFPVIGQ